MTISINRMNGAMGLHGDAIGKTGFRLGHEGNRGLRVEQENRRKQRPLVRRMPLRAGQRDHAGKACITHCPGRAYARLTGADDPCDGPNPAAPGPAGWQTERNLRLC